MSRTTNPSADAQDAPWLIEGLRTAEVLNAITLPKGTRIRGGRDGHLLIMPGLPMARLTILTVAEEAAIK